ncbi:MAG: helix-hairpin-helix domain-containing protein, partial [Phascolarctobacterium sp.]|nr:helix-hairpin-helix domain-containing protein [Phascolarctobacterium sp.]
GYEFEKVDLYKSHPTKFLITEKGLRPPLASLAGVGNNAALSIAEARDINNPFISREDLRQRAGIGKAVIERLADVGVLDDLPESNQIDLF